MPPILKLLSVSAEAQDVDEDEQPTKKPAAPSLVFGPTVSVASQTGSCACAGAAVNSESAPNTSASIRDTSVPRLFITESDVLRGGGGKTRLQLSLFVSMG